VIRLQLEVTPPSVQLLGVGVLRQLVREPDVECGT
jgi:hypothetical protein